MHVLHAVTQLQGSEGLGLQVTGPHKLTPWKITHSLWPSLGANFKVKVRKLNFKVKVRKMILSHPACKPLNFKGITCKSNDHTLKGLCTFATDQKHKMTSHPDKTKTFAPHMLSASRALRLASSTDTDTSHILIPSCLTAVKGVAITS